MAEELRREDFEPLIGQHMNARFGDEDLVLEVGTVAPIANPSPRKHAPFALVLLERMPSTGRHRPVGQGLYRLEHPTLGELEVFLVPIGPKDGAMRFEGVFN
jgi:hypothetical protein